MDTIVTDAHRLLALVRGLPPADLKARLVAGLDDHELMTVLTALPSRRLDPLLDTARQCRPPGERDVAAGDADPATTNRPS